MTERRVSYGSPRTATPRSPINFRMPTRLRDRLRRFAEERGLGESDALRLVVSEKLDEVESERELQVAERWQFKQAYATARRILEGKEPLVDRSEVDRVFEEARARLRSRRRRK